MFFEQLIRLLNTRPMVPGKTTECLRLWESLSEQQQTHVYNTICAKLQAGKFVHYDPVKAIQDNTPKPPRTIAITADAYYSHYHTQENRDGWVRTHLPAEQRTIYIKKIN